MSRVVNWYNEKNKGNDSVILVLVNIMWHYNKLKIKN